MLLLDFAIELLIIDNNIFNIRRMPQPESPFFQIFRIRVQPHTRTRTHVSRLFSKLVL